MPIHWGDESSAWVERHGDFYRVFAIGRYGSKVLLLITCDEDEARTQAQRWQELLADDPNAKMHWDMRLNYLPDLVREDDLRHDADLERDGHGDT